MTFTKSVMAPIAVAGLFVAAVVVTQHYLRSHLYYPNVVITTQDKLSLEFLNEGVSKGEDCQATAAMIADTIRASCPTCNITRQQCHGELQGEHQKLLSEEPIDVPSSRLPHGVVAYASDNIALALAACRESERLSGTQQGFLAICYPPNTRRPLSVRSGSTKGINAPQAAVASVVLVLTGLIAAFTCFLIVRYEAVHLSWSLDPVEAGPQKFHATPTPRIGGLGLMAALLVSGAALLAAEQGSYSDLFGYLVFASLPAFLGGITEDVIKNVGVITRLVLTMLSAALGAWLLGAVIPRFDVPGIDTLMAWTPLAIAFTIFAVGGVANAVNIIDGYNGLAAGHAVIVLAAMAYVSTLLGDVFLLISALAMIGALLGFLAWNYPKGKIFLGDGGAYLLGFWLAELSVLLVGRHPEVSPWFPLLLLVFPIFETVFSMYRRRIILGLSPGQPDRFHMHQVIYARLAGTGAGTLDAAQLTRQNSRVAPYFWSMSLCCALPAILLWKDTPWLVLVSLFFCVGYVLLYRRLRVLKTETGKDA